MFTAKELFERRRARSRTKLRKVANGQPRLTVHRSSKHIYAQIVDDGAGNVSLGGDKTQLSWDHANERLGINTDTPLAALHVRGDFV